MSYMFRLQKEAIVRPYVSENVTRKLKSCSHTYVWLEWWTLGFHKKWGVSWLWWRNLLVGQGYCS